VHLLSVGWVTAAHGADSAVSRPSHARRGSPSAEEVSRRSHRHYLDSFLLRLAVRAQRVEGGSFTRASTLNASCFRDPSEQPLRVRRGATASSRSGCAFGEKEGRSDHPCAARLLALRHHPTKHDGSLWRYPVLDVVDHYAVRLARGDHLLRVRVRGRVDLEKLLVRGVVIVETVGQLCERERFACAL
jgi:hypothetical protein